MRNALCILTILLLLPACGKKETEQVPNSGAGVSRPDKSATVALPKAAKDGDLGKVKRFLASDIDVNTKDEKGNTALHNAAIEGHLEVVELLLANGADINAKNNAGNTPLHYAASGGQFEIVRLLVNGGVDPNVGGREGMTPLHVVCGMYFDRNKEDHLKIAEFLIQKGADSDAKDEVGMTPLHRAAQLGDWEMAEFFVVKGSDVNTTDKKGRTPLDLALERGSIPTINLLRRNGSKTKEALPLDIFQAVKFGDIGKVKRFLAETVDANSKDANMWTPLHYAAGVGNVEIADLLIAHGADVNQRNLTDTPLHIAAYYGHGEIVGLLIANGADTGARTASLGKSTPLHIAVRNQHKEIVKILIEKGCDVNTTDEFGETPLDDAKSEEMKELLRAHGAVSGKDLKQGESK